MNYYDFLGVPSDAPEETIRSAYRAMARRYHPDAGKGSSAKRFQQVMEAYETLSDPIRRRRYDRWLLGRQRPITAPAEPLTSEPQPLTQPRRHTVHFGRDCPATAWPGFRSDFRSIDELFDDLIRALEDDLPFGTMLFRR